MTSTTNSLSTNRLLYGHEGRLIAAPGRELVPDWVQRRYESFRRTMVSVEEPHPCHLGTDAEIRELLRYTYLQDEELAEPHPLADSLLRFLEYERSARGRTALVVYAGTASKRNLEEYERAFWRLLEALHQLDLHPWPPQIPTQPDHAAWTFCFGGRGWFINAHTPLHRLRRSRYSDEGMMLVMQTRENLAGVAGDSAAASLVRTRIRTALRTYDAVPPSRDLGTYLDPDTREWRQYWLADDDRPRPPRCPLDLGVVPDRKN